MRKKISYDLDPEDINKVEFSCNYITNRQERPSYLKDGFIHEESYIGIFKRRDMYWINCKLQDEDLGAFCVDPDLDDPTLFTLHKNYIKVDRGYIDLRIKAEDWFRYTTEYQNQIEWSRNLKRFIEEDKAAGYEEKTVVKRYKYQRRV